MTSLTGSLRPQARPMSAQPWLHSRRFDLTALIFSIILAGVPYAAYLLSGGSALDMAASKGTAAYNARLFVNSLVTLLVGGPHMYATFTRTIFDTRYLRRKAWFLASTILVPVAVIASAVWSYETYIWLLTVFFAAASLHALYQVIWLTEAYNLKARQAFSWRSRLIDYGLVLASLYPIATYRMIEGTFTIGPVTLKYHDAISLLPGLPTGLGRLDLGLFSLNLDRVIGGRYYLSTLAFLAFGLMLVLFTRKSWREFRTGSLNLPKTLLIVLTVALMFFTPSFANLDTAFQGVNTWHSFQYLALTWYAVRLQEQREGKRIGFLHWTEPRAASGSRGGVIASLLGIVRRLDGGNGWTAFYLVCMAMLPISGLIFVGAEMLWPGLHAGLPGADETYMYMGVLSILLMHYVQDALLFTDARSLASG